MQEEPNSWTRELADIRTGIYSLRYKKLVNRQGAHSKRLLAHLNNDIIEINFFSYLEEVGLFFSLS